MQRCGPFHGPNQEECYDLCGFCAISGINVKSQLAEYLACAGFALILQEDTLFVRPTSLKKKEKGYLVYENAEKMPK